MPVPELHTHDTSAATRGGFALLAAVVLLMLLFVIAAAFLVTARNDRLAVGQYSINAQADLLQEGLTGIAEGVITDDLFANGVFEPELSMRVGLGPATRSTQTHQGTPWLASRLPQVSDIRDLADDAHHAPYWRYVSSPLIGDHFDSPWWPQGQPVVYSAREYLTPTQTALIGVTNFPAFLFPVSNGSATPVLAADADGDGIADAGLVKLPMGPMEGITYYCGLRIVDHSSAINAATAWEQNPASTIADGLPGDFFASNIHLGGLLANPRELNALNQFRFAHHAPPLTPWTDGNGQEPRQRRDDFFFASPYDAMWMQLGRRLGNPGALDEFTNYQALPISEEISLEPRFCVGDRPNNSSLLQRLMPVALGSARQNGSSAVHCVRYAPGDAALWFNQNFAFDPSGGNSGAAAKPLKSILTVRNPTSNFCPNKFRPRGQWNSTESYRFGDMIQSNNRIYIAIRSSGGEGAIPPPQLPDHWVAEPWSSAPTKTSVNTADFGQLWLAYWNVMSDAAPGDGDDALGVPPAPLDEDPPDSQQPRSGSRMFRRPLRSNAPFGAGQELLLRAALAAINTLALRNSNINPQTGLGDVISRLIHLPAVADKPPYDVTVFGCERQPFVTEIFARNDANPQNNYIAVELFNPYPQPMQLRGWALGKIARPQTGDLRTVEAVESTTNGSNSWTTNPPIIGPGGYLVLASSAVAPSGTRMPPTAGRSADAPLRVVPDLVNAFGFELVLLRPRRADGLPSRSADPADPINPFDEGTADALHLDDFVPVDSYDLSNLSPEGMTQPLEWHYIRPNESTASAGKAWHFVYPGRCRGPESGDLSGPALVDGTSVAPAGTLTDLSSLGRADRSSATGAAYRDRPVQLKNTDFAGPFPVSAAGSNHFPFGAFARNGDILQVPFIGAYRITAVGGADAHEFCELNAATMDAAFADDEDDADDYDVDGNPVEQVGHFVPIDGHDVAAQLDGKSSVDDFGDDLSRWRYRWAARLFDYLTVQSPQLDYLPDVDPAPQDAALPTPARPYKYLSTEKDGSNAPQPIANLAPRVRNAESDNPQLQTEETAAVEGLVNINTAPWRVLAAVPWAPPSPDRSDEQRLQINATIAQAIVDYRDGRGGSPGHGPFASLFELNRVPIPPDGTPLRELLGSTATSQFGPVDGKLAPYRNPDDPLPPGVPPSAFGPVFGDFASRCLTITRVSNLLTTRSDCFTVYLIIQGWRFAETPRPELVVQRRITLLLDRSRITPQNHSPFVMHIPTD